MDDLTIPARLVAEGVGLPRMWAYRDGWSGDAQISLPNQSCTGMAKAPHRVDLTDKQTAFGLALKLDEWERAGHVVGGGGWAEAVACGPFPTVRQMLSARLAHIGMDHAIRRALGWLPPVGSPLPAFLVGHLETLRRHERGYWMMGLGSGRVMRFGVANDGRWAPLVDRPMPALAGITDPAEALAAIYKEVCGG